MTGDGTAAGPRLWPLGGGDPPVLGPYRLLGRLGAGGMGRIYLGRVGPGAPLVAVKTLLAEGDVSAADRKRFTREVALAQRIDNAYTARVVDADPAAPSPWMAIQYIPAPSLAELVRRGGHLPASAIRWIAAGTAQALDALHRQGVVHRDVKPQNILLPMDGPRLIDFGISHAQDITRTTVTLGTIAFTSPEQARGEPSTAASDMYSLGATLFHLAVGRPPYPEGENTLQLLLRVSRGELDLTGLPKELVPLVRPCLEANPHRRPRPEQVLQRFLAELTGLPTSRSGRRWLPPRWTEVIETYEQQGRAWQQDLSTHPGELAADRHALPVPPPEPTRPYTRPRLPRGGGAGGRAAPEPSTPRPPDRPPPRPDAPCGARRAAAPPCGRCCWGCSASSPSWCSCTPATAGPPPDAPGAQGRRGGRDGLHRGRLGGGTDRQPRTASASISTSSPAGSPT
ncbi:serine/threonine-protein kinase [Streptomyces sp. CC228A]|uniref:serine/threonine-protein kinase n=1 Tax=Streptomyces sp. CC228A TaxID=2898186 RepID=UPI001F3F4352|nr:serine/threonine-protein kinase [Streptomyces sp. CC228A]